MRCAETIYSETWSDQLEKENKKKNESLHKSNLFLHWKSNNDTQITGSSKDYLAGIECFSNVACSQATQGTLLWKWQEVVATSLKGSSIWQHNNCFSISGMKWAFFLLVTRSKVTNFERFVKIGKSYFPP